MRSAFGDVVHRTLRTIGVGTRLHLQAPFAILDIDEGPYRYFLIAGADAETSRGCVGFLHGVRQGLDGCDQMLVENAPFLPGPNGSNVSPGISAMEFVSMRQALDRMDRPLWIEFETGGIQSGLLVETSEGRTLVTELRADRAREAVVLYTFSTVFGRHDEGFRRSVHDPVGTYVCLSRVEAEPAGLVGAPDEEVLAMMTREADMAALACAGLSFPDTEIVPCPRPAFGRSRAIARLGRDTRFDGYRVAHGLEPWPPVGPTLH